MSDKKIPDLLNDALAFNIDRIENLFHLEFIRALGEYDLTPEQYQIMVLVWYSPESFNQQDITRLLGKDKHNISRMVRRLEAKGWLKRHPDPHSRALFVHPTDLGQKLKDEIVGALYNHFGALDLGLSQVQEQELVALLKLIRVHLGDEGLTEGNNE